MAEKKVAILQSNYIPWKGYFDMIAYVDEFIIFDDAQYTKNDWRNRNLIKTPQGVKWLTVPVGKNIQRRICDVEIDSKWQSKHWKTLISNYGRAQCFPEIASWLETMYLSKRYNYLSELNRTFIEKICDYLGIRTVISNSWDYELGDGKTSRLINLCLQAGGTEYVTGLSAASYIEEERFCEEGVKLKWFDYESLSRNDISL